jgi:signal transduction histidine kinase
VAGHGAPEKGLRGAAQEARARRQAEAERDEYRRRLDLITGSLGVGFALIGRDYRIRWINDALRTVFGEIAGVACYEAFQRRPDVCPGCGVREVFEGGAERVVREQQHYDAAGRPVWFEVLAAPVRDAGGAVTGAVELFVPLTERKRAEERLARHLEHERLLAELATAAVRADAPERFQEECVALLSRALDVSRIYVFEHRDATDTMDNTVEWVAPGVSPERERLQGIPAAAVPWWMEELRADRVVSCADVEEIPGEREKEILRSQGIRAVLAVPLFVGGRYFGFLGFDECRGPRLWLPEEVELLRTVARFLSIILERRRAEEALRAREAQYRQLSHEFHAVLDAIPDTLVLQSPKMEILWANRGAALGVRREPRELLGRRCYEIWHGRDRPCDPCPVRDCLASGQFAECCTTDPEGRTWELRAVSLHGDGGAVTGVIELARDITARRRAEAEREALIAELRSRNEALDQFTYTVSHDLKGPLTTIRGFAGLMEREAREGRAERVRGYARQIGAAAERMQRLLDDLLGLSRIGRLTHEPLPVSLLEVAQEAAASYAVQAAERGVQVEIAPDLPVVQADRTRLREVLENLLGNALKFLGDQPQPSIRVGWRTQAGQPVFYVQDNGVGIAPEQRERVFGLFEKLDPHSPGTGIGLAIVKRIVEVHGGRVWVESEGRGTGSTFCFTLPTCA